MTREEAEIRALRAFYHTVLTSCLDSDTSDQEKVLTVLLTAQWCYDAIETRGKNLEAEEPPELDLLKSGETQ